jgi:hypothetical protein
MQNRLLVVAVLCFGLFLSPAASGDDRSARSRTLARARELHLAADREWLRLLHYDTGFFGGRDSEVARGPFFLSPRGKSDHEAELIATLTAFFDPVVPGREDSHALCRFPARREWLDHHLHFLQGRTFHCPTLDAAMARVAPTGVSLVYASSYVGNPASAFGHTFLYLATQASDAAGPGTRAHDLASFGIEYRANTDTKNALLYAVKGLTGLFPGRFETPDYDHQVDRYTIEQARDLWEYSLDLSSEEIRFLVFHLWELKDATIDYYYLTRNCSFEVMELLETAAPRLSLLTNLKPIVLPIDTVRAVAAVPGLIRNIDYRPSLSTRLHARFDRLTISEQWMVRRLLRDPSSPWPEDMPEGRRPLVLDAAIFELEAHSSADLESPVPSHARTIWRELVARRSGPALPEPLVHPDWDVRPELAHGSMRVLLGTGWMSETKGAFGVLGYRLALHDLTDPPDGSPELSQLVVLDAKLRYALGPTHLALDTMTFVDLVSLNPIAPAEPLLSFRTRAFGLRVYDGDCRDCFVHGLDGSLGTTVATRSEKLAFFLMADAFAGFLPDSVGAFHTFVRLGVGPFAGFRFRAGETVGLLTGTLSYLPGERLDATFDAHVVVKHALSRGVALGVELDAQPLNVEGQLSSYVYF